MRHATQQSGMKSRFLETPSMLAMNVRNCHRDTETFKQALGQCLIFSYSVGPCGGAGDTPSGSTPKGA